MSDIENIEIRVCLIGEEGVGKKSIISRFKILNSSTTTQDPSFAHNKKNDLKKVPKNMNDSFFTKKYTGREKMKLQSLISFSKILTISNFNIELKFFPISHADNLEFSDKINEEDEALREHKLKFDNMKSEIERVIMKQPTNPSAEVKYLFLFVIDLKNFEASFDKIKIYYDELNRYLKIDKQYFKAFIGNKVDVKSLNIDREGINEYMHSNNFNFYEISTKMFYNFEKFFERLFFEIFESSNASFSTKYFKERFNYVMSLRQTFGRAERTSVKTEDVPGPQKYDSNVYSIDEIKPVFGKERFNKKIFVNKKGPIFDFKNEIFLKKQNKSTKSVKTIRNPPKINNKEEKEDFETTEKKRKLKDEMFGHNAGISLGIKPSQMQLRRQRKGEYQKNMIDLDEIFDLDNINSVKEQKVRSNSANSGNKSSRSKSNMIRKKNQLKQRVIQFKIEREKLKTQKEVFGSKKTEMNTVTNSKSNEGTDDEENEQLPVFQLEATKKEKPAKKIAKRSRSQRVLKKAAMVIPGPAAYDTRGKLDLTKGYTFGGRYAVNEMKNNYGPGYLYLDSDIDTMLKQPKFAFKKSSAPRFKETVLPVPGDARAIEEKLRYMEENRLNELNKNTLKMREWENKREGALVRKEEKDEYRYRKLEDAILKKEEKERLKRVAKGLKPIDHSAVNYNLVEETAPLYTMKGRYEQGFLGVQDYFDDPSKLHGLEQSVSYLSKNLTKNLNPLPNYKTIKPNLPSFSIPTAERFEVERTFQRPGPNSYYPDYEVLDRKPGSYKQTYMGTGSRFKDFEYSYIPGPGNYKIKGFSDNVIQEAQKKMKNKKEDVKYELKMKSKEVKDMMEMIDSDNFYDEKDLEFHNEEEMAYDDKVLVS